MKPPKTSVHPYRLPLKHAWRTARSSVRTRAGFLFRWEAEDGLVGWGDAAPLPGAAPSELAGMRRELGAVARTHDLPLRARASVVNAVSMAALDAGTQRMREPMWKSYLRHLPSAPRTPRARILVNATLPVASQRETVRWAAMRAKEGYLCLKIKAGPAAGVPAILGSIRERIGPRVALRLDVNGSWSRQTAMKWLPRLEGFGLEYVEQPLPSGHARDWKLLRRSTSIPVAADEELAGPHAFAFLKSRDFDVAILKPMVLGANTLMLAHLARAAGLGVVVTDGVESAVGRQAALHLAVAVGSPRLAQGVASGEWFRRDVVPRPPRPRSGAMAVPTRPGLGLEVKP